MRIRQKRVGVAYWAKVRKDLIFILSLARDEERYKRTDKMFAITFQQFCNFAIKKPIFFLSKTGAFVYL